MIMIVKQEIKGSNRHLSEMDFRRQSVEAAWLHPLKIEMVRLLLQQNIAVIKVFLFLPTQKG